MIVSKKPSRLNRLMEAGVVAEAFLHFSSRPWMRKLPIGDGHPVLVIPGFFANDALTSQMRTALRLIGYNPYGWEYGANKGLRQENLDHLKRRLAAIYRLHKQPVSIIGWSLGGFYARALANLHPELARQVITMGTPIHLPKADFKPGDGTLMKMVESLNRPDDPIYRTPELWLDLPQVPLTSVFTKTDGIAHWQYCLNKHDATTQNIGLPSTHTGLMHNPLALYVVAERLRFNRENWRPMKLRGWRRLAFDSRCASTTMCQAEAICRTSYC